MWCVPQFNEIQRRCEWFADSAGVLRNTVQAGSPADDALDLRGLTNDVVLPLINGLLDVNLEEVVAKVSALVAQVVSRYRWACVMFANG